MPARRAAPPPAHGGPASAGGRRSGSMLALALAHRREVGVRHGLAAGQPLLCTGTALGLGLGLAVTWLGGSPADTQSSPLADMTPQPPHPDNIYSLHHDR